MPFYATILVRTERNARGLSPTEKFVDQARKVKGVADAFHTYGRFDAAVFLEGRSYDEVGKTAMKLQEVSGVRSTETLVQLP